ncbi:hypothetical protein [Halococcus sp. AFM35]|uniref:hypothetical protein n=1 Tax=Halococcus sp. AFM35 TaxID=3421653 RepID=UPI003EBC7764
MNPLWKGFYPLMWPLFIPSVPVLPAMKILLIGHYIATAMVAYWYASEDFNWRVAVPLALLFVSPMALYRGLIEKILGWPWFVLIIWQLTRTRMRTNPRRHGLLAGIGLGVMLLTGSIYNFFYAACILGCVVLATKNWPFVRAAVKGSFIGLPKIVFSIIPTMLAGAGRPTFSSPATLEEFVAGLIGFWVEPQGFSIMVGQAIDPSAYRAVGLPVVLVAVGVIVWTYWSPSGDKDWITGVAIAAVLGTLLASEWSYLYELPVVRMFRLSARATVVVAMAVLLLTWYALHRVETIRFGTIRRRGQSVLALLVILSAINGIGIWSTVGVGEARELTVDDQVANDLEAAQCGSVWIEGMYGPPGNVAAPYQKPIGYELTQRGISLRAVNYGDIGQEYRVHRNGKLTFDALIVGARLPREGSIPLTGGWRQPIRGTIDAQRFELYEKYQTDMRPVYVYTPQPCRT